MYITLLRLQLWYIAAAYIGKGTTILLIVLKTMVESTHKSSRRAGSVTHSTPSPADSSGLQPFTSLRRKTGGNFQPVRKQRGDAIDRVPATTLPDKLPRLRERLAF